MASLGAEVASMTRDTAEWKKRCAMEAMRLADFETAAAEVQRAIFLDRKRSDLFQLQGDILLHLGDVKAAQSSFQKSVSAWSCWIGAVLPQHEDLSGSLSLRV
mmetsp:Transcript_69704/g.185718  ORF Transcript_69704/g.185718 Transcript_69704/m.185718 type:complete len:103 (+) Transcript_69704:90-398(+)